jgi:hypothetical protein
MKKGAGTVLLAALVTTALVAGDKGKTWTCSLTGKTVEKCCCVSQKDGKLYCTLAQKTIDSCCCKESDKQERQP